MPTPRVHPLHAAVLVGSAALLLLAGCGHVVRQPAPDTAGTVWLCRPGQAPDPCAGDLAATAIRADGTETPLPAAPVPNAPADCFYVYPTVSREAGVNADLRVQRTEVAAAEAQAARFSQVCDLWAPMYRQETASELAHGLGADPAAEDVAYASLLAAWRDYLAHDNDGRPVVFIGHSQGAALLIRLLQAQIDTDGARRGLMVSAILLGGNVTVPTGQDTGGTFAEIPACRDPDETGCVIAYSAFTTTPPADSLFGRPGRGVSLQSGQTATAGLSVLCTNPAALGGGSAPLDPYFLSATSRPRGITVSTPWVTYPDLYTASCQSAGGATWLQVTAAAGDPRPVVTATQGPRWGLHTDDVNLALGNLVDDVQEQIAAYLAAD